MQVKNIFKPFEIQFVTSDECPIKIHKNTFFELVIVVKGTGLYHMNQNQFIYQPEHLFLLRPMVVQYTEVKETTSFLFIRFNTVYLKAQQSDDRNNPLTEWIHKLEYIFTNSQHLQGPLILHMHDKPLVRALTDAIIREHQSNQAWHQEIMQQLINTLITLVARNIPFHIAGNIPPHHHTSLDIIGYIHEHIYDPDKLKAEAMAAHFNISLNYISEYFKKHTQQTLQQYIINYKLGLVATRLHYSDKRLNEIAFEFGFTDESHLTKMFKKYKGMSPAVYRKTLLEGSA